MVRRLKSELPPRWDGSPRVPGAQARATSRSTTRPSERRRPRAAGASTPPSRRATRGAATPGEHRHRLRRHAAQEAAVLLAGGVRRHASTSTWPTMTARKHAGRHRWSPADRSANACQRPVSTGWRRPPTTTALRDAETDALAAAGACAAPLSTEERALLDELRDWARARPGPAGRQARRAARLAGRRSSGPAATGTTSGSSSSPSTATPRTGCTTSWLAPRLSGGDRLALLLRRQDTRRPRADQGRVPEPTAGLDPVRILLATDAASEGIDLQHHCHRLHPLRDPVEPQPPGAAQRPHRPPRPARARGGRAPLRAAGWETSRLHRPARWRPTWSS